MGNKLPVATHMVTLLGPQLQTLRHNVRAPLDTYPAQPVFSIEDGYSFADTANGWEPHPEDGFHKVTCVAVKIQELQTAEFVVFWNTQYVGTLGLQALENYCRKTGVKGEDLYRDARNGLVLGSPAGEFLVIGSKERRTFPNLAQAMGYRHILEAGSRIWYIRPDGSRRKVSFYRALFTNPS